MAEAATASNPTSDRKEVRFGQNFQRTADYHLRASVLKQNILERRRALGKAYLRQHQDRDPGPIIPQATAFASVDMSHVPTVMDAVAESRRFIASRIDNPLRGKGSLHIYSNSDDYGEDSPTVQMMWLPEVLCPVIHYFGLLPIFSDISVTRANATELLRTSSHMYHSDPDDTTQMKLFVHVSDVDAECGPFHALPADDSAKIDAALNYPRGRVSDEDIERVAGRDRALASVGGPGTVTFCDTTRCYHFGGRPARPGKPKRELLMLRYLIPTSTVYPQFAGDGEMAGTIGHLKPKPGDAIWNAFIGAELVY